MLSRIYIRKLTKYSTHLKNVSVKWKHTEKIIVEPRKSLVTDRVSICGEGFQPKTPITIRASINCHGERLSFLSYGQFVTSLSGCFDLSTSESVGGTYCGVDDMGLFWSMKKTGNSLSRLNVNDARTILAYNFAVYSGHLDDVDRCVDHVCNTVIERCYIANNVRRTVIKNNEVRGTLFTPDGNGPFPARIVIYGGTKRGKLIEDAAAIFSNHGYVTLSLAFYSLEGLPKSYVDEDIRIEYFEKAVEYLRSLTFVQNDAIGVYGISMGGGIGLAMASFLPQIKFAVCINSFVTGAWTRITYGDNYVDPVTCAWEKVLHCNEDYAILKSVHPEEEPSTIFPIEQSSADILFVVGLDDPSNPDLQAGVAKKRMDIAKKRNYEIIKYPGMGHLVDPPFMPVDISARHPLSPKGTSVYYGGKDKKMHNTQVSKVWNDVLSFLQKSLNK